MASTGLTRTPSSTGNRKTWTLSVWLKRSNIGSRQYILRQISGGDYLDFQFQSNDTIQIFSYSGSTLLHLDTNRVFRDTNAWYHFLIECDTTQATASNRCKFYVNGVQETSFSTETYPSQNTDLPFNNTNPIYIGTATSSLYFDGEMAHFNFTDGTAYPASTFGETDSTTGIWKPKTSPSVTYGTNGFFLKFDNSGNMGLDSGGGSNNFTTSGTILQYKDTPSNNMPQLNVNDKYAGSVTNAGRTMTNENNASTGVMSTLAVDTGKWYWEAKVKDTATDTFNVGMRKTGLDNYDVSGWSYATGAFVYAVDGYIYKDGSQSTNTGATAAVGDIIGFIVDLDAGTVKLQKNGSNIYSGNAVVTGLNTGDFWHVVQGASQASVDFNFGDGYFGTTPITSAGSNGNGLLFEYDVPSGHFGISTKNMAGNS